MVDGGPGHRRVETVRSPQPRADTSRFTQRHRRDSPVALVGLAHREDQRRRVAVTLAQLAVVVVTARHEERASDGQRGHEVDDVVEAPRGARFDEQARQRRIQRQPVELGAARRERTLGIEGAEGDELVAGGLEGHGLRCVEEREVRHATPPRGRTQHQRHQRLAVDLRRRRAIEDRGLAPEAVADAGARASGASGALCGAVEGDGAEGEKAPSCVKAGASHEARVDDDADAGQRERRLGDVRREDELSTRGGLEAAALLVEGEPAVQRNHLEAVAAHGPRARVDLGLAG